jgi:hypothetical protein
MKLRDEILQNQEVKDRVNELFKRSNNKCSKHTETIALDNWDCFVGHESEFQRTLLEINEDQTAFVFKFNGDMFRPDLNITSTRLKRAYDSLPKTKTKRDLLKEVYDRYGVETDLGFHIDLDEKMTDEEYNEHLKDYSVMGEIFKDVFDNEDDSNDDL